MFSFNRFLVISKVKGILDFWFNCLIWRGLVYGFCFGAATTFAAVEVYTSPENLNEGGTQELLSGLTFVVYGDEFAGASEVNPMYLKISLPEGIVLSQTLAGPNQPPVYLAVTTLHDMAGIPIQVEVSPSAITLVRHVAGESAVWIRISESSSCWLRVNGEKSPPSLLVPLLIQTGVSGLASMSYSLPLFSLGLGNLPFNSASPEPSLAPGNSAGTELVVDLSNGNLPSGGFVDGLVSAFSEAMGVETSLDPEQITTGAQEPIIENPQIFLGMVMPRNGGLSQPLLVESTPEIFLNAGSCETAGQAVITAGLDAFPSASAANPVYIRAKLSNEARLCATRVDMSGSMNQPLYLALRVAVPGSGHIQAPPDTLSIVRWKQGEDAIWLKLIHPSTEWATVNSSPGTFSGVSFALGQTAEESEAWSQAAYLAGEANLPANTLNLSTMEPASTSSNVDLSSGGLSEFTPDLWMLLKAFTGSAGVETASQTSAIQLGNSLGLDGAGLIGLLVDGLPIWGGVLLNGIPREMTPNGVCETAGNLNLTVGDDLFFMASPENPVYLRLALPSDTYLCQTLVDPAQPDPVLLAISLENPNSSLNVVAPADTLSIVRWKAGESEIWLKVKHPSTTWLSNGLTLLPPNEIDTVKFGLGVDAVTTETLNQQLFAQGKANLPGNTLTSLWLSVFEAVSTEIGLDISQASMVPNPQPSGNWRAYVKVEPSAWMQAELVETATTLGILPPGSPTPLVFQGVRDIGFTTTVTVNPPVAVQGTEIMSMEALVADDVNPVDFKWINSDDNTIIGTYPSIIFDPIPTGTIKVKLEMRDALGRVSLSEGTLIVNPDPFDLNQDGKSDIQDLYFALPEWNQSHDILFLISIPLE